MFIADSWHNPVRPRSGPKHGARAAATGFPARTRPIRPEAVLHRSMLRPGNEVGSQALSPRRGKRIATRKSDGSRTYQPSSQVQRREHARHCRHERASCQATPQGPHHAPLQPTHDTETIGSAQRQVLRGSTQPNNHSGLEAAPCAGASVRPSVRPSMWPDNLPEKTRPRRRTRSRYRGPKEGRRRRTKTVTGKRGGRVQRQGQSGSRPLFGGCVGPAWHGLPAAPYPRHHRPRRYIFPLTW